MPARAKRYTFADTSFRQARTTQQPVHAWKKVWTTPAHLPDEAGQTVVHEDEDEEIASSLASQLPPDVATDPVPISDQVSSPVLPSDNADQGVPPQPTDNSATQGNDSAGQAENAVEAAVAAVEDVAAATYSAHAIGNINATAGFDYPAPDREDMSVDGDNSAPASPPAAVDSMSATMPLPEPVAQPAAEDGGAANYTNDNETTNSNEQGQ
ncbi:hypothetical protein IWW39_000428 [Coemansia spiralis]|uniref:Uncharacterized protein n=1 Tax=Coemansia spiralis TaxID=417178 RepID=A0A9W8GS54_9FUNG|nr:hypothetical protein IWW39_000428 [Coemansia spiralis]